MTDSRAALDPDRLPWLNDDRPPRSKRAWVSVLLLAILATILLAGLSYWLGMQSVRRVGDTNTRAPSTLSLPRAALPIDQPPQTAPIIDQVSPLAMPEVAPVAEPQVTPPRVTDQRAVQPRIPAPSPAGLPSSAAKPAPATAPPQLAPSANPPALSRLSIQSRASFNCRLARARWEIAVCNNGDLASLDRDLAALTADVSGRADAAKRARLVRTRDRFVARRNACQSDACTKAAYDARLRELSEIMTGTVAAPASTTPPKPPSSIPSPSAAPVRDRTTKPAAPTKPAPPKATAQPAAKPRAATQSRASFDCRFARTSGEIAVCNNGNLGLLDRQLALLYSQALGRADAAKRARLVRTRDRFVARRDACQSEMCTRIAYENRMRQVSDIMFGVDRAQ